VAELAFVALGSNLGDRHAYLARARMAMASLAHTQLIAASRVEETAPLGAAPQGPYLNQMVVLGTALPPLVLLAALQRIERGLGRVRGVRWGARTIDLDIVKYGDVALTLPSLTVPHPRIGERGFWRRELAELNAIVARAA
jgi:2-amino-4-hydroxy-6-hydroxymethyldihydropteridine pyrophosphokinase